MRFIKTSFLTLSIGLLSACGSEDDSGPSFKAENLSGLYEVTTEYPSHLSIRFNENHTGYIFNPDIYFDPYSDSDEFGNAFTWSIENNGSIKIVYADNTQHMRLTLTNGRSSEGQLRVESDFNLDGVFEYFEDNVSIKKSNLSTDFEGITELDAGNYSLTVNDTVVNYTLTNDVYSENSSYKLGVRNGEYVQWTILESDPQSNLSNRLLIITKDSNNGEDTLEEYLTAPRIGSNQIEYAANIINDANITHSIEYISKLATWEKQPNPTESLSGGYHLQTEDKAYSLRFNDDNTGYLFYTDKLFDNSFDNFGEEFTWTEQSDGYIHLFYELSSKQQKLAITSHDSVHKPAILFEDSELDDEYEVIKTQYSFIKQEPDDFTEEFSSLESIEFGTYILSTGHGEIEYELMNLPYIDPNIPYYFGTRNGEQIIWINFTNFFNSLISTPEYDYSKYIGRIVIIRISALTDDGVSPNEYISLVNGESNNGAVQLVTHYKYSENIFDIERITYLNNDASWKKSDQEE